MLLDLPLKYTRAILFSLTTISSIIAGAAGVNAIRKSNAKKSAVRHSLPPGVSVTITTSDMEDTIIVLFVVTSLLSMQIPNFLLMLIKDWFRPYWRPRISHPRNGVAISTRTLGLQCWYLVLNLLAILAVLIPATIFAAHRMPDVKAFLGGVQRRGHALPPPTLTTDGDRTTVPASVVQAEEAKIGVEGVYWNYFPVRFVIVSNWVNVLFTLPAILTSFVALSRRKTPIKDDTKLGETTSDLADEDPEKGKHVELAI